MLSFKIKEGALQEMNITGTLEEISADVCCMIFVIYQKIKDGNKRLARIFKESLEQAFRDGIIFMSVEERDNFAKNEMKARKQELKEMLKGIIDDDD